MDNIGFKAVTMLRNELPPCSVQLCFDQ